MGIGSFLLLCGVSAGVRLAVAAGFLPPLAIGAETAVWKVLLTAMAIAATAVMGNRKEKKV